MVLVYQSLGSVNVTDIKEALDQGIRAKQPKAGITATAFRIRNAVAAGTKDEEFARFFQASNLVVGWQVPEPGSSSSSDATQQPTEFMSSRTSTLQDLCGDVRDRQPQFRVSQRIISDLIDVSLKLPVTQPLALLACYHKSQRFTTTELSEWQKLDEAKVLGELLGTLEGVPGPLLYLEEAAAKVHELLVQAAGSDLASTLDQAAARSE